LRLRQSKLTINWGLRDAVWGVIKNPAGCKFAGKCFPFSPALFYRIFLNQITTSLEKVSLAFLLSRFNLFVYPNPSQGIVRTLRIFYGTLTKKVFLT